jgi:D-tyrosyl-tRNA(Tyr) deacylase
MVGAAEPGRARELYERVCERMQARRGVFGAHMEVESINDGPVTFVVDYPAPSHGT